MTKILRSASLALALALTAFAASSPAQERQKEPTDGFFDVPPRAAGEESEPWGLPAYMVTSTLGGFGVFILCKSSRRS